MIKQEFKTCQSRFAICDMGYYTCQLKAGHSGNHKYSHIPANANSWPERKYTLEWEQDILADTNVTEKMIKEETNLYSVINAIKSLDTMLNDILVEIESDNYSDKLSIWVGLDFKEKNLEYEVFSEQEMKVFDAIDKSVKLRNRPLTDYKVDVFVNTI